VTFPSAPQQGQNQVVGITANRAWNRRGAPTLAPLQARGCPDENDFSTPQAGRASMRCPSGRNFHVS